MVKTSKALLVGYCVLLGNLLLLALYLQTYSTKVYVIKREEITTAPYRINATEESPTTTYNVPIICKNTEHEPLQGPVRPNPDRAAELYWIQSNLSRPLQNYEKSLGGSILISSSELKRKADILSNTNGCSNYSVAIIIPFRDREHHLQILLGHLIPILRRQGIRFTIFVVEQHGKNTFNKGRLMNTGFEFAAELGRKTGNPYDCFIFQDVDLLVEHDTLPYRCSDSDNAVHHLSTGIDKFKYQILCCGMTVGGVLAFREKQFREVNGYPNSLWGWGGEDDDINGRIRFKNIAIERPSPILGRFTMVHHKRDVLNPTNHLRHMQLRSIRSRLNQDGLSDLDTKIKQVELYPLFVKVTVKVGLPPDGRSSIIIRLHKRGESTPKPYQLSTPEEKI